MRHLIVDKFLCSKFKILRPSYSWKLSWDILHSLILIFLFAYIPALISFQFENVFGLHLFFFLFFLSHISIQFNLAYYKKGFLIVNRKKIIIHYLKTDFICDMCSLIVFFIDMMSDQKVYFGNQEYKILIFLNLGKIRNLNTNIIEKLKIYFRINVSLVELINVLFFSIYFIHTFACFFHYISINFTDPTKTWLAFKNAFDQPSLVRYEYSLYWSTVTILTVGYGDITPQNDQEFCFTIFTVLIGCLLFAYIINSLGNIVNEINRVNKIFKHNIIAITNYMERKNVNRNLQMKIREYLRYIWMEEYTQEEKLENEIIEKLPKSLKDELILETKGYLLNEFPLFFANFTEMALKELMYSMEEVHFSPEDVIFSVFLIFSFSLILYTE